MENTPVSNMLSPQLIRVRPDTEIPDVLDQMQQENASCVIQVNALNHPTGIFTEQALVQHLARQHAPLDGPISQLTLPAFTISGHTPCNEAFRILSENNLRQLIVVDDKGQLMGMVNESDFIHHMNYIPMVLKIRVRDVMSRDVRQLSPEHSVLDALQLMDTATVSCVVITEARKPLGILTERDIVRLATQLSCPENTPLYEVMHTPVFTLAEDILVRNASNLMEEKNIRRFVVTNCTNEVSGIITLRDITKALQQGYVDHLEEELNRKARQVAEIQEQLIELSEKSLFSRLMNQVSDSIFIIRADDFHIVDANQRACHHLGYTRQELSDQNIKAISSAAATLDIQWLNHQIDQAGSAVFRSEHRHKHGHTIPVEINATRLEMENEIYYVSVARDISERIKHETAQQESEETYRSVIGTALDGFWMTDTHGNLLDVNQAYCDMSGYDKDELLSMTIPELDAMEQPQDTKHRIKMIRQQGKAQFISQHRHKHGNLFDVEVKVTYWPKHGGRIFAYLRDITEQRQNELRLRQAAAVFENTSEAVMVVNANLKIQMVNKAFTRTTGYEEADVIGESPAILQSGQHSRNFYKAMWHSIRTYGHWQGEVISRRADGSTYPELLNISAVRNNQDEISHYVGVFADLSELKESASKLAYLDYHDPLTGLANRKTLMMRADHAIRQANKEHGQVALMILDLDRFKNVNDSYGHNAGDDLLKQVAQVLDQTVPHLDTLARLGGDEFALLFDHFEDVDELSLLSHQVISRLNQPWKLTKGQVVTVGASIGISLSPQNGDDANTLLQHADAALYQAKAEGRARFSFFSDALTRNARNQLELETRMHQALENDELCVFLQPQTDILSNDITGAEALVRWQHPEKGLLSPFHFIELCEQNGQINRIGHQVLLKTCQLGKQWLDEGNPPMTLAVNLSARQLSSPDLYNQVCEVLERTGYPPQHLELELTESALMGDTEATIALLDRFRALGIHIAIDDFGTGYSSFAYLKRFPIDVLKIDKSFVDEIEHNSKDREIIAAIIAMGHALGIKVLAEGVESPDQLALLQKMGCDVYQGYLMSPPLPVHDFERLITEDAIGEA